MGGQGKVAADRACVRMCILRVGARGFARLAYAQKWHHFREWIIILADYEVALSRVLLALARANR